MTAPDFRACRATVLEVMAELETDTRATVREMATAQRLTQADADWNGDMLTAAYELMVERGLFANELEAEDALTPGAEAIQRERAAARMVGV